MVKKRVESLVVERVWSLGERKVARRAKMTVLMKVVQRAEQSGEQTGYKMETWLAENLDD